MLCCRICGLAFSRQLKISQHLAITSEKNAQVGAVSNGIRRAPVDSMDKPYDIQERTFQFSVEVVTFCRSLTAAHPVTRSLGWQLLKASTSVGANMEEADGGQTKPDFIAKTAIARKEAKESVYWLRLIVATDSRFGPLLRELLQEANEIAAIVTAIKRNAEANLARQKHGSP